MVRLDNQLSSYSLYYMQQLLVHIQILLYTVMVQ